MYAFAMLTVGVIAVPATYALFEWVADATKPPQKKEVDR